MSIVNATNAETKTAPTIRTVKTGAIRVGLGLSLYGDALLFGETENGAPVAGSALKHRLFAWHEASYYGTELAVRTMQGVDLVELPAEQVIPFFADPALPAQHIGWEWTGEAAQLVRLAPLLARCVEEGKYVPDFAAFLAGRMGWIWDEAALEADERRQLAGLGGEAETISASGADTAANGSGGEAAEVDGALRGGWTEEASGGEATADDDGALRGGWTGEPSDGEAADGEGDGGTLRGGLRAAFAAAVASRFYGTEATAADLRREFPALFAANPEAWAGMDAESWLVAIGWKSDTAPFRPALQLLEPDDADAGWRLRLVLQDKRDAAAVMPMRLSPASGEAFGSWPGTWSPHVRERSAGWLERLRATLPPERFAETGDDALARPLDDEAAWRFLTADSRRLLDVGWQVLLPAWWEAARKKKPRLRAKVKTEEESRSGRSLFGLDAIIDFDWRVAIGDADLSEEEFMALVARNERLVQFRGEWVALDPALLAQIRRMMEGMDKSQGLSFQDVLQLHLLAQDGGRPAPDGSGAGADEAGSEAEDDPGRVRLEVELNAHLSRLIGQINQDAEWPKLEAPSGLRAELRGYQRDGFSWLAFLGRFGLGACLADDMGLGKTVQLISYLLHRKEMTAEAGRPALIVCPTSVLGNWQKELSRFAPSLSVMLHYGSRRSGEDSFRTEARQADIVLTSYATAALDQELLKTFAWGALCLDEAQNIKNAQTKQSAAVRSFPAAHRIALTGTPIENRLAELWSIYDFINPGYLGSQRAFNERFASAIEKDRDEKRIVDLQRLVKPFMLRRKKKDPAIQLDLPEKNEMKTYVNLTADQAALYDQTVNQLLEKMKTLEGIERKGAILGALTQLKQVCDHPLLLTKEPWPLLEPAADTVAGAGSETPEAPGADRAGETGATAAMARGSGTGVPAADADAAAMEGTSGLGTSVKPVDAEALGARAASGSGSGPDAPSLAPLLDIDALANSSSKLERLLAMVKELRDEDERCLIFTQYIGMGEMLREALSQELREPVLYLNGSTTKKARDRMIERFQSRELPPGEQPGVFILSLKAGGVGLNLTAANHVFHFDRWWNPAVENQATDRAYRMGQTRDVQVHKFIALGTLEERIDEMLESKQQLSDNVISASEGWITELSTEEIKDLFTLRRGWADS